MKELLVEKENLGKLNTHVNIKLLKREVKDARNRKVGAGVTCLENVILNDSNICQFMNECVPTQWSSCIIT